MNIFAGPVSAKKNGGRVGSVILVPFARCLRKSRIDSGVAKSILK